MIAALLALAACGGPADDFFFVEQGGAVLPVQVRGAVESGELLLFVQGGPGYPSIDMRAADYVDWGESLEPHLAVAYTDQRGTGNALGDYTLAEMTVEDWIADLDAVATVLADRYPDTRLTLLSHSWGSYLAARTLREADPPADAWISVNGTISYDADYVAQARRDFAARVAAERIEAGDPDPFWGEVLAWAQDNPTIDAEDEALSGYLDGIYGRLAGEDPALSAGAVARVALWSHYNMLDSHLNPPPIDEILWPQYDGDDLRQELTEIQVETTLINGSWDDIVPDEIAEDAAAALPHAALERIFEAGHSPFLDQPQAFAEAVLEAVGSR